MVMSSVKEDPLFNIKKEDAVKFYHFIYAFIMDMKEKSGGKVKFRYKAAVTEPGWAAAEILFLAMYGYTKKTKFAKKSQYLKWRSAPKSLETRVIHLLGKEGKRYILEKEAELRHIKTEANVPQDTHVDSISYRLRTDSDEVQLRMQKYMEDFDLHSAVDIDVLKNLVQTQILIETAHQRLAKGEGTTMDLKSLATQLKDYALLLGLSKKDRIDFGAERKKGSIAELATVYEQTIQEYPELEHEFFVEELNMLLDKHERLTQDGEREISSKSFRIISGGYTIEEALSITGRKRKNAKPPKGRSSNS